MESNFLKLYTLIIEEIKNLSKSNKNKIGSDITEALPCIFFNAGLNSIPEDPNELKNVLIKILNDENILQTFKYNTFKSFSKDDIINSISNTWLTYDLFVDKIKQANQILSKLISFTNNDEIKEPFAFWTNLSKGENAKPQGFPSTTTADICVNYNNDKWFGISLKAQKSSGKAGIQNPSLDSFLRYFIGSDTINFEKEMGNEIWNNIYKPYFNDYISSLSDDDKQKIEPIFKNTSETDFLNKSIKSNWKKLFETFLKLKDTSENKFENLNNFKNGPFTEAKNLFLNMVVEKINSVDEKTFKNGFLKCVDQNGGGWPVYIWKAGNSSIDDMTDEMNSEIPTLIQTGDLQFIKKTNIQCVLLINDKEILTFEFRHSHSKKEFFGTEYTFNGSSTSSMFMIPLFDKVFIKI